MAYKKGKDPLFDDDDEEEDEEAPEEEVAEEGEGEGEEEAEPEAESEGEEAPDMMEEEAVEQPEALPTPKPKTKFTPLPKSETTWIPTGAAAVSLPVCTGRKNSPHASAEMHKAGTVWSGGHRVQRYRCPICGRTTIRRDVVKLQNAGALPATSTREWAPPKPTVAKAKKRGKIKEEGFANHPLDDF